MFNIFYKYFLTYLQSKYERPKEERIDHYRPKGEEFDKAYTYAQKSRTDDTEISEQKVTSEKINVSRRDITRMEETEKPRYPIDLNVERIVIEEIPDEKSEVEKHEMVQRDEVKLRHQEIETDHNVDKVCRKQAQEESVKVGRLDITDYEKSPRESKQVEDRTTTYTAELEEHRKVRLLNTI